MLQYNFEWLFPLHGFQLEKPGDVNDLDEEHELLTRCGPSSILKGYDGLTIICDEVFGIR